MSLYNIVGSASLAAGQPEDVSQVVANLQAIQTVLNGGIDDVNIRSTAAIAISKLAGYPADSTKHLIGDGSWVPRGITKQVLAGTGTYITPAGVRAIFVECIGGGGGGGSAPITTSAQSGAGGGGGGGAYAASLIFAPLATYAYVVGAGGAA